MIDWDKWSIQQEKGKPNDAGIYLLDLRASRHRKLNPGHEVLEKRWVIPMGPEGNPKEVYALFEKSILEMK